MAKLPGAQDLGFVAPEAARPVGSFDATPIARGAEQIAQGAQRLGAGISQVGAAAAEVSQDESRWQYAKAHSDFISRKVDLDAAMVKDQNYGPDAAGRHGLTPRGSHPPPRSTTSAPDLENRRRFLLKRPGPGPMCFARPMDGPTGLTPGRETP